MQGYPGQSFLLGFVEFDDQGKPYIRDQITTLFNRIEAEAQYRDLCMVVFVHGWKHNDAVTDTNLIQFLTATDGSLRVYVKRKAAPTGAAGT